MSIEYEKYLLMRILYGKCKKAIGTTGLKAWNGLQKRKIAPPSSSTLKLKVKDDELTPEKHAKIDAAMAKRKAKK